MQLHEIKPKIKKPSKKRIGRGGKRGTYSGKGNKGQKSRAGTNKSQPLIRRIIKRYPKLRGYNFGRKSSEVEIINISVIQERFEKGELISPKTLLEKKLVQKKRGKIPIIKILGNGEIKKNIIIQDCLVSKSAKEKIEKAGGEVKILNPHMGEPPGFSPSALS